MIRKVFFVFSLCVFFFHSLHANDITLLSYDFYRESLTQTASSLTTLEPYEVEFLIYGALGTMTVFSLDQNIQDNLFAN